MQGAVVSMPETTVLFPEPLHLSLEDTDLVLLPLEQASELPSQQIPEPIPEVPITEVQLEDERATNYPSTSFERFRTKIEGQLGGSINNTEIQGRLLLLMYRKICQLSQQVRDLRETGQKRTVADSELPPIQLMRTTEEYWNFVEKLKDRTSVKG